MPNLIYTEDRLMDTFLIDTVQNVLEIDANPSIRPLTHYIESPDDIRAIFDRISYDKGDKDISF